jgi:alanine dehydrogenase
MNFFGRPMMIIATIKEIKDNENRVGLIPSNVKPLIELGSEVWVQKGAGVNSGFSDEEYEKEGAKIVESEEEIVKNCDILVKVKEPIKEEYRLLELMKGKTLYTYLHLSGVEPELTRELMKNRITAIAYETIEDENGLLPCLKPMSEIAGILSIQFGAQYLQRKYNGRGITLGKIDGLWAANVLIMGGGIAGRTAARTAAGMGSNVIVVEKYPEKIEQLKKYLNETLGKTDNIKILSSSDESISEHIKEADLLVGAVLIAGAKAPKVVSEEQVKSMRNGSVIVDISIDQGGCIWGSRPTSHSNPIYELEGKIYCCITNMPGQASRQSTYALNRTTFPHLKEMAKKGVINYLKENKYFAKGLNVFNGKIALKQVALDLNMEKDFEEFS